MGPQIKKSKNIENQDPSFKSQHLVINPGQGPPLKCAPGHESMEDFNIIKSYWLKHGVVDFQNCNLGFWAIVAWGKTQILFF